MPQRAPVKTTVPDFVSTPKLESLGDLQAAICA
jgi:hypothetical protein